MDDLISRQDAIDALCSRCAVARPETCSTIKDGDKWCEEVYTLLNLPSASPEPRRGKWIKYYKHQVNSYCSVCNKEVGRKTKFCPNCGAEMERSEDD